MWCIRASSAHRRLNRPLQGMQCDFILAMSCLRIVIEYFSMFAVRVLSVEDGKRSSVFEIRGLRTRASTDTSCFWCFFFSTLCFRYNMHVFIYPCCSGGAFTQSPAPYLLGELVSTSFYGSLVSVFVFATTFMQPDNISERLTSL